MECGELDDKGGLEHMKLKSFLGLVEIRTKLASIIPFLLGTVYALYHFQMFNGINFLIMLLSLLSFDMVTTALNNYFDYKRAKRKHGYNYESHNTIVSDNLRESTVLAVIGMLLGIATVLGILLVVRTNITVLLIGMLSFAVGILYSFGPVPISRTPLGELLSGFFMGFVIIFLSVYIHVYDRGVLTVALENAVLSLRLDLLEVLYIFLLSIPVMCGIANIMLANNICDIEDDLENRRYTLPIYIGRKNALRLFRGLYYLAYIDIMALVLLRLVPFTLLLVLLTLVVVNKNLSVFDAWQSKKDTFPLAVKNFLLMGAAQVATFGVTAFIVYWI